MRIDSTHSTNEALLLSARQAARLLGIGRKTLRKYTAKEGEETGEKIPAVRIGRVLRYRPETLARWVSDRESKTLRSANG